jgi:hypothetical protein
MGVIFDKMSNYNLLYTLDTSHILLKILAKFGEPEGFSLGSMQKKYNIKFYKTDST